MKKKKDKVNYKDKKHPGHFVDRFDEIREIVKESKKPIEKKPSQVIDIGENYQIVTGIDEEKAGGIDPRLMPNLHKKWLPSDLSDGRPYNAQLYKNASEQEFYEDFIQPLFIIYKNGQIKKGVTMRRGIQTHHWERQISLEALGPEKVLFEKKSGRKSAKIGEIEITLILVTHFLNDLYKYSYSKIARRFGSSIVWVKDFKKRIQTAYGKLIPVQMEDHLERQMGRCEGILNTFMPKARDGDPYAAKIVKDFMDKEDQYIMPTIDQLPVKDNEEKINATLERLEKILERKRIENKSEKK